MEAYSILLVPNVLFDFFFFQSDMFYPRDHFHKSLKAFLQCISLALLLSLTVPWKLHLLPAAAPMPQPKSNSIKKLQKDEKMRSPILLNLLLLLTFAFSSHHYQFLKEGSKGRLPPATAPQ